MTDYEPRGRVRKPKSDAGAAARRVATPVVRAGLGLPRAGRAVQPDAITRRVIEGLEDESRDDRLRPRLSAPGGRTKIRRYAVIGEKMKPPREPLSREARGLVDDNVPRRFHEQDELERFATNEESVDTVGMDQGANQWRAVGELTLLGESHTNQISKQLIKALGTKRYRYEGNVVEDDVDAGEAPGADFVGRGVESILARGARTLPDFVEMYVKSGRKGPVAYMNDCNYVLGKVQFKKGFSTTKALYSGFRQSLEYLQGTGKAEGAAGDFYRKNQPAIDTSLEVVRGLGGLQESEAEAPEVERLPIVAELDAMCALFKTLAFESLGTKPSKLDDVKKKRLSPQKETAVQGTTKEAQDLDALRDLSMAKTLKSAKEQGDLLFVVGDAHREKLTKRAKDLGVPAFRDEKFIAQQDADNLKAEAEGKKHRQAKQPKK